jgi:hypothetical protein
LASSAGLLQTSLDNLATLENVAYSFLMLIEQYHLTGIEQYRGAAILWAARGGGWFEIIATFLCCKLSSVFLAARSADVYWIRKRNFQYFRIFQAHEDN